MIKGRTTSYGRAFVIHPHFRKVSSLNVARDPDAALEEAVALAYSIDLDVTGAEIVNIYQPQPNMLIGKGTVDRLADIAKQNKIDLIIVDYPLTPVQQRNLEKAFNTKVIDRTGLILEIFGARARTKEGQLQVELAALTYQRSRLVRSWTHLERQRGGFGFLGGPGESQLEIDRRLIDNRIIKIKEDLESVSRTRSLHRKAREKVPFPVVALVGYTNAGKSSLFNRLSGASVVAKDQLFATLDPTMRLIDLGEGKKIILSDTVGFVSNLPTLLVAAFRATLEEVLSADIILHVRDIAHKDTEIQKQDVENVLEELGINVQSDARIIEVLNKIDKVNSEELDQLTKKSHIRKVAVSALTGEGVVKLKEMLSQFIEKDRTVIEIDVPLSEGALLAWLYERGKVISRQDKKGLAHIKVSLDQINLGRFKKLQTNLPH